MTLGQEGRVGANQGMAAHQGMALVGCGSAAPAISISNQQLSERVDTSDDWIRSRTGIGARRIAAGASAPAASRYESTSRLG